MVRRSERLTSIPSSSEVPDRPNGRRDFGFFGSKQRVFTAALYQARWFPGAPAARFSF
jgi:hypothetical protein